MHPTRIEDRCDRPVTGRRYIAAMTSALLASIGCAAALVGCAQAGGDAAAGELETLKLPSALRRSDFSAPLDKPAIRGLQSWLDDASFEVKWQAMLSSPLDLLGGASSAFHADLARLPTKRLPGDEVLCHGDPKIDNFGWTRVAGIGVFSDNDFDDAGFCPVADDALHYLVATDLAFHDADLDAAALEAYVDTVGDKDDAIEVDPDDEPAWNDVRADGLAKTTLGDRIVLGGEVQAATAAEQAAVRAAIAADSRFPPTVLDIAGDVRTERGSAGLRRFWVLTDDVAGPRTIIELKELGIPGTEFARHTATLDGADRFDVLQAFWWDASTAFDHFEIALLGARWLVRDRFTRTNVKPDALSNKQRTRIVEAEASVLALHHRKAWHKVKKDELRAWLRDSAAVLVDRWRATYTAAGGG
jgi:Uncharacterized protein conserved in bacteria (DUF2252)